ncbi:MAG TPA: hypothetical protein VNH19_10550 [Candidatus Limnocylindrales bacterium]|nr:hypothetical protein [Candidatus Limnocylindrales bacterium]
MEHMSLHDAALRCVHPPSMSQEASAPKRRPVDIDGISREARDCLRSILGCPLIRGGMAFTAKPDGVRSLLALRQLARHGLIVPAWEKCHWQIKPITICLAAQQGLCTL